MNTSRTAVLRKRAVAPRESEAGRGTRGCAKKPNPAAFRVDLRAGRPSPTEAVTPDRVADGDSIYHLYLREIGQVKLLSREDEVDLARRVQQGDQAARDQMITANLRLVVKIAREFEGFGLPLLDLISEGNIGLMKAVERFNPDRGVKLSSYASFWIKQAVRRALANHAKTIRLPVHVQEKLLHLHRASLKLREILDREPTDAELGDEVGLPEVKVRKLRAASQGLISLDACLGDDPSNTVSEIVADESIKAPEDQIDDRAAPTLVHELMQELDPRELTILRHRYGLDGDGEKTLEQVSQDFGLTRERIRQIQNRALRKMREKLSARATAQVAA